MLATWPTATKSEFDAINHLVDDEQDEGLKKALQAAAIAAKDRISFEDSVFVLGSCFADAIGARLRNAGMDACVNPFGTLYNPLSIAKAIKRLESGTTMV